MQDGYFLWKEVALTLTLTEMEAQKKLWVLIIPFKKIKEVTISFNSYSFQ